MTSPFAVRSERRGHRRIARFRPVTCFVRCKKRYNFGDLARISKPARRNVLREVFLNASFLQLGSPGARKRSNRRLARAVNVNRGEPLDVRIDSVRNDSSTLVDERQLYGEKHPLRIERVVRKTDQPSGMTVDVGRTLLGRSGEQPSPN